MNPDTSASNLPKTDDRDADDSDMLQPLLTFSI